MDPYKPDESQRQTEMINFCGYRLTVQLVRESRQITRGYLLAN